MLLPSFRVRKKPALVCRYTELASLIDPKKTPKTDRNLILDDAVRVITQLRVENNQLRQLNKLLEERVQEQEAPRGQALYQSYLISQGGLQPPPRVDGASTSNLVTVPGENSVLHLSESDPIMACLLLNNSSSAHQHGKAQLIAPCRFSLPAIGLY